MEVSNARVRNEALAIKVCAVPYVSSSSGSRSMTPRFGDDMKAETDLSNPVTDALKS